MQVIVAQQQLIRDAKAVLHRNCDFPDLNSGVSCFAQNHSCDE